MRTIEVNIYKFDELSDKAKEKAHEDYISNGDFYHWGSENEASLKAFQDKFPVTVKDWSYGGYRDNISFSLEIEDEVLEFTGIRLLKYIWNNFGDFLYTGKYYSTSGHYDENGKYYYQKRYSKTTKEQNLPTGFSIDCSLLGPFWNFIENFRENQHKDIEDLISEALHNWIRDCTTDYEHAASMENFEEMCEANEWEFEANGSFV